MSAFRCITTLNTVGVILLLIGIGSAGLVVRLGQPGSASATTTGDWKDSTLALTDSKTATRNIELYGGKVEVLMVQLLEWIGHPTSLASLIATLAALMALACFLVARHLAADTRSPQRRL